MNVHSKKKRPKDEMIINITSPKILFKIRSKDVVLSSLIMIP